MNVFRGILLRISQTDTLLRAIAMANLDPSAENASTGSWMIGDVFGSMGMGIDMRETKEKLRLFVSPESE
jgi:hypothetical protein